MVTCHILWHVHLVFNLSRNNGKLGFNTGHGDLLGCDFTAAEWAGKWVHVTAVFYNFTESDPFSPEKLKLYLNGQRQTLSEPPNTEHNNRQVSSTLYISGCSNANYRFHGVIDDVRVYNRELSTAEIQALAGKISNTDAIVTSVTYDAAGNVISSTDASGQTSYAEYDSMNRVVRQTLAKPSGEANSIAATTTFQYDDNGNLISTTDPSGDTIWYQYDALNRQVGVTDALGYCSGDPQHTTTTTYDPLGNIVSITDPLGQTTNYEYDNLGRQIGLGQYDPTGLVDVADLVGYWKLDDGEGTTAADSSGNGLTGDFIGTGQQWVEGKRDGALEFDGSNQVKVLNVPADTTDGAKNTVSFWMKWDGSTSYMMPCSLGFHLTLRDNNIGIDTGQGDLLGCEFSSAEWAGQWVHITAVFYNFTANDPFSSDKLRLYINGQRQEISDLSNPPKDVKTVSSTLCISGYDGPAYRFDGVVDDVRVYDRELSASEVINIMSSSLWWTTDYDAAGNIISTTDPLSQVTLYQYDNLGREIYQAQMDANDLIAYWSLNEYAGDTAEDVSENKLEGTLLNGAVWTDDGAVAGAIELNGLNSYVEVPDDDNFTLRYTGSGMTLSVWAYVNSTETDGGYFISKPWNGSTGEYNYTLSINDQRQVVFGLQGATTQRSIGTTEALSTDEWHNITATVDSSGLMVIYVDGIAKTPDTYHNITDWEHESDLDESLAIGTIFPNGSGWGGGHRAHARWHHRRCTNLLSGVYR